MLYFLLIILTIFATSCIADTDIDVEINTNINIYSAIKADGTVSVELCQDLQITSPEPEEPETDSGLKGKWDDCDSHDECETGLCFCYMCVDIADFMN